MRLTNLINKKKPLNEAEEVQLNTLKPQQQKQVKEFEKILDGKHKQIWSGIHGVIVDIEASGNFGSGYRFGADHLKKLLALKIRWIEADGDTITIAF
jgi:hypothetical protein